MESVRQEDPARRRSGREAPDLPDARQILTDAKTPGCVIDATQQAAEKAVKI